MIIYDSNNPSDVLDLVGSNIPRAVKYTIPSVAVAVLTHYVLEWSGDTLDFMKNSSQSSVWSATVIVLGVLLGMRTNNAYQRFWEGITLVQLMRAEWFEATSNLVAFSLVAAKKNTDNPKIQNDVKEFQFTLVRLMSLMHGTALRQIGGHEEDFEVLDINALDAECLKYLAASEQKRINPVEVLLQWIQVLTTDCATSGVLAVPPPILTRVYQTLSRGMVNLHNARKLAECPFPFPLVQMVYVLLFLGATVTPVFLACSLENPILAGVMTFVPMFGMWSITFTAGELEQPFGNDPNDLNLNALQRDYNTSLLMLLDQQTMCAPRLVQGSVMDVEKMRAKQRRLTKHGTSMTNSLPDVIPDEEEERDDDDDSDVIPDEEEKSKDLDSEQISTPDDGRESSKAIKLEQLVLAAPAAPEESKVLKPVPEEGQPSASSTDSIVPTKRAVPQDIVIPLAEECVGALTAAIVKLLNNSTVLHHRGASGSSTLQRTLECRPRPSFNSEPMSEPSTTGNERQDHHERRVEVRRKRFVSLGEDDLPDPPTTPRDHGRQRGVI